MTEHRHPREIAKEIHAAKSQDATRSAAYRKAVSEAFERSPKGSVQRYVLAGVLDSFDEIDAAAAIAARKGE